MTIPALALCFAPLLFPVARVQASQATLTIEADVSRPQALGLDELANLERRRDGLREILAWRLAASGVSAEVVREGERFVLRPVQPLVGTQRAALARMLANLGRCEIFSMVEETDEGAVDERKRFEDWRKEHPLAPLALYNADPSRPLRRVAWFSTQFGPESGPPRPVWLPSVPSESFGAADFEHLRAAQDSFGYPSLATEIAPARQPAFRDFTTANRHRRLAIVLEGVIVSAPTLEATLSGSCIIEGRFEEHALTQAVERLAAGGLVRLLVDGVPSGEKR